MRRWLVALAAVICGGGVSAGLLWYERPDAGGDTYYVLARDLPAGGALSQDAVRPARMRLGEAGASALGPATDHDLSALRATHDLAAGQLLQRADVAPPESGRRRVLVPLHDVPPVAVGDSIDLLLVSGSADHTSVRPFALALRVQSVQSSGVVLSTTADQASALVYASATQRLVAVAAGASSGGAPEPAVASLDEAQAAARR